MYFAFFSSKQFFFILYHRDFNHNVNNFHNNIVLTRNIQRRPFPLFGRCRDLLMYITNSCISTSLYAQIFIVIEILIDFILSTWRRQ